MSLPAGIAVLALAVALGGVFAAVWRKPGHAAFSAIRTFAVVAAAAIALLHLLPEAIASAGWGVLAATALGLLVPAVLERAMPGQHDHTHDAPTTALAMGYAAVIVHQAGEGAAVAALARTGALSYSIVVGIAAHTVPLAMVVAIRVLEARGERSGPKRAMLLALGGVAGATVVGAAIGSTVGATALAAAQPWILAAVAGILLHALSHDALAAPGAGFAAKAADTGAGWAGLAIAALGVEEGAWLDRVHWSLRVAAIALVGVAIAARSFWPRAEGSASRYVH